MLRAITAAQVCICVLAAACQAAPLTERQIIGAWSWTYIEGVGRVIFAADHTVKTGFPPNENDGRKIGDDQFDIVQAGIWRLDGDLLVTEMDNKPLIELMQRLDSSHAPPYKKEIRQRKIVSISEKRMVFDDGSVLERVQR